MIQYRILCAQTMNDLEKLVESAINDEKCNWELHESLVVVPSGNHANPFVYFQSVIRETSEQRV